MRIPASAWASKGTSDAGAGSELADERRAVAECHATAFAQSAYTHAWYCLAIKSIRCPRPGASSKFRMQRQRWVLCLLCGLPFFSSLPCRRTLTCVLFIALTHVSDYSKKHFCRAFNLHSLTASARAAAFAAQYYVHEKTAARLCVPEVCETRCAVAALAAARQPTLSLYVVCFDLTSETKRVKTERTNESKKKLNRNKSLSIFGLLFFHEFVLEPARKLACLSCHANVKILPIP